MQLHVIKQNDQNSTFMDIKNNLQSQTDKKIIPYPSNIVENRKQTQILSSSKLLSYDEGNTLNKISDCRSYRETIDIIVFKKNTTP